MLLLWKLSLLSVWSDSFFFILFLFNEREIRSVGRWLDAYSMRKVGGVRATGDKNLTSIYISSSRGNILKAAIQFSTSDQFPASLISIRGEEAVP